MPIRLERQLVRQHFASWRCARIQGTSTNHKLCHSHLRQSGQAVWEGYSTSSLHINSAQEHEDALPEMHLILIYLTCCAPTRTPGARSRRCGYATAIACRSPDCARATRPGIEDMDGGRGRKKTCARITAGSSQAVAPRDAPSPVQRLQRSVLARNCSIPHQLPFRSAAGKTSTKRKSR